MRWIKHLTGAHQDEKMARLVAELGLEGYGFYWLVLETVAGQIEAGSDRTSVSYPIAFWRKTTGFSLKKLRIFAENCADLGIIAADFSENSLTISIPNILKYRDEWSRKKGQNSGATPEQLRSKDTDTDIDVKTSLNSKVLPKAEAVFNSTRSASAPSKPGAARTKKPADTILPETGYRTKKGRILDGKRLDAFERFWSAYGYAKGKAEAADAWLDIPQLTETLVARIVAAAEREAAARPALLASGRTPKMAQGWITARRWEDGEEPVPRAMSAAEQRVDANRRAVEGARRLLFEGIGGAQ